MASPLLWSPGHQVQGSKLHRDHMHASVCCPTMLSMRPPPLWARCAVMSSPHSSAHLWCRAAGFIATELVSQLLAKGYEVRGTVRDPNNQAKVAHLVQLGQVREL